MSRQSSASAKQTANPALTRSLGSSSPLAGRRASLPHLCIQREADGESHTGADAATAVREVVGSPGRPLDAPTRSTMEGRFGYDLSGVRVHTDGQAAASAQAVGANAYTAGSHIAFGSGRYTPGTTGGQKLMAHELTHVVQQSQGPVSGTPAGDGMQLSHPSDTFEREAHANANAVAPPSSDKKPEVHRFPGAKGPNEQLSVQRDDNDASAVGSVLSGGAGVLSAAFAGIGLFYAARSAAAGERQALAAEDPPQGTPTLGGLTVNHADITENKMLKTGDDLQSQPDKTETTTTEVKEPTVEETIQDATAGTAPPAKKGAPEKKKRVRTTDVTKRSESVRKDADKPTREETFPFLRIRQVRGRELTDYASFGARIVHNGEDIKSGGTEDREKEGYLGGTHNGNGIVTFKSRNAPQDAGSGAGVFLSFTGMNVPPRTFLPAKGGYGGGAPEVNKNYQIQSFSGGVAFRTVSPQPGQKPSLIATPSLSRVVPQKEGLKIGDGKKTPFFDITLDADAARAALSLSYGTSEEGAAVSGSAAAPPPGEKKP